MWPYILTTIAVAVFPLALAGYGGHLATLAMPEHSKERRRALLLVWGLAICGVLLFAVSQIVACISDIEKDHKDEGFKASVLSRLNELIQEPDRAKQKQAAIQLQDYIGGKTPSKKSDLPLNSLPQLAPPGGRQDSLPSYSGFEKEGQSIIYPEDFYSFVPYVWGFPPEKTYLFQQLMVERYQSKFMGNAPFLIRISYLQGDPSSYSLALFLQRVYSNAGWDVQIIPRTDIGHVKGIYLFQDSIEQHYEGVSELRKFAMENGIPFLFGEQPGVKQRTFEIWSGKGPDQVIGRHPTVSKQP